MINALTVDVEDYWSSFSRNLLGQDIEPTEAVVENTEWFLKVFNEFDVQGTFFVLGEVAQKYPSLIKRIAEAGHEIGVHGYFHKQVFKLTKEEFRREVSDCKKLLEDIAFSPVLGHRAPVFSIMPETRWALDVLAEEGFKYDSSVCPVAAKHYGWPGFGQDICKVDLANGKSIIEVPMSTVSVFGKQIPVAGGGYLRHFPYWFTNRAMTNIQNVRPVIVYVHPYEVEISRFALSLESFDFLSKLRILFAHRMQLRNRNTVKKKIYKLLTNYQFGTISDILENSPDCY